MVEKIMKNEEAKNFKIEENQRKFEELMNKDRMREQIIQKKMKEENEKRLQEEIMKSKEESLRDKQDKKKQWLKFLEKLKLQKEIDRE